MPPRPDAPHDPAIAGPDLAGPRRGGVSTVSGDALDAHLARMLAEAPDHPDIAGLFGPESMLWRVDRESLVFLGAARALLLQLAHPWVAAGVAAHSMALDDPVGRFHRTFGTVYPMIFGTADQAFRAARRLHRRHGAVTGALADGMPYAANDPAALAWVQATLAESTAVAWDLVLPPLPAAEREGYWAESRRFARLFGLDPADLPATWDDFRAWMAARLDDPAITVTDDARRVVDGLFHKAPAPLRPPRWYLALTRRLLPARLADGFGLPDAPADHAAADRMLWLIRRVYPRLPTALRFVGPWHEAMARLSGRPGPGPGTRLLNRLWIGRPLL